MSQMTRAIGVSLIGLLIVAAVATQSFSQDQPSASTAARGECVPCSEADQKAEFDRMMDLYRAEVKQARDNGYQCGSDPNYSDPGLGYHKVGNCADWAATSWRALVRTTWKCWRVVKIRARHKFWATHHNFVYIVPKCGGKKIFFDPWMSGRPDTFSEDVFKFTDGFWGLWMQYPLAEHAPGDPPRDPEKDK